MESRQVQRNAQDEAVEVKEKKKRKKEIRATRQKRNKICEPQGPISLLRLSVKSHFLAVEPRVFSDLK